MQLVLYLISTYILVLQFINYITFVMEHENGSTRRVQRLKCCVQNYDWGRIGTQSGVGRLFSRNSGVEIDQDKPYAELWMGTHVSAPSFLVDILENDGNFVTLEKWIQQNPNVLGDKVVQNWGTRLPFLFKVLSIRKALSIQAHPDKRLAEILNSANPNTYRDDNHKPEMVIAVTDFEALCGFITFEELKVVLQDVPEISVIVGTAYTEQVLNVTKQDEQEKGKAVLQSIFTQLMSANKEVIFTMLRSLIGRLMDEKKARILTSKERLVLRLQNEYPDDVGVIASLFFNYVKLDPGEALYLGANEPHAYIYGECIECMATSDNVVRAGLTSKKRDIEILCSMLTYNQGFPEILKGVPINSNTRRYTPPFDEFEVDHCILQQGASVIFSAQPGPSIFLVTSGNGTMHSETGDIVSEGDVLFAPASTELSVTAASELHLYRAGINSRVF